MTNVLPLVLYSNFFYNCNGNFSFDLLFSRHGQAPTIDQTEMFIRICNGFLEKNPGKIIGMVLKMLID